MSPSPPGRCRQILGSHSSGLRLRAELQTQMVMWVSVQMWLRTARCLGAHHRHTRCKLGRTKAARVFRALERLRSISLWTWAAKLVKFKLLSLTPKCSQDLTLAELTSHHLQTCALCHNWTANLWLRKMPSIFLGLCLAPAIPTTWGTPSLPTSQDLSKSSSPPSEPSAKSIRSRGHSLTLSFTPDPSQTLTDCPQKAHDTLYFTFASCYFDLFVSVA